MTEILIGIITVLSCTIMVFVALSNTRSDKKMQKNVLTEVYGFNQSRSLLENILYFSITCLILTSIFINLIRYNALKEINLSSSSNTTEQVMASLPE